MRYVATSVQIVTGDMWADTASMGDVSGAAWAARVDICAVADSVWATVVLN